MAETARLTLGDNGDIRGLAELLLADSEQLANPAFKTIAANRIANFATHRYAET